VLELRPPRVEEAAAIADALNALSRSLVGSGDVAVEDVESWFALPSLDPEQDMRVAVLPDGAVAGYADLGGGQEEGEALWIDLRLRPGHDAAGQALVEAMEARAAERGWPGRPLRAIADAADPAMQALLRRNGYRPIRSSFVLEIDLSEAGTEPAWPAGLRPRAFRPGVDDERVYEAHQAAFADHWDFHRTPYEEWRAWSFGTTFDPALWFLVEDGDELAAVCLCRPRRGDDDELGWVSVLGVRTAWRRRGLGRALLLHAFGSLRARGLRRAGLGVDAENVTGAVALYESVGMREVRRSDIYEKGP
jgi:mycothiol synthase